MERALPRNHGHGVNDAQATVMSGFGSVRCRDGARPIDWYVRQKLRPLHVIKGFISVTDVATLYTSPTL